MQFELLGLFVQFNFLWWVHDALIFFNKQMCKLKNLTPS
jgi:hypothetical protein